MSVKINKMTLSAFVMTLVALLLTFQSALAAPIEKLPITVYQPDGTQITLYVTGDEYYHTVADANGYTVVKDSSGHYVYANLVNNQLVPTDYVVGSVDPTTTGLEPGLNLPLSEIQKIIARTVAMYRTPQLKQSSPQVQAPKTGTLNNIVVFIRFSDQSEYTDNSSIYTGMLNTDPGSMKAYFLDASYNQLTVQSNIYPTPGATIVSYQDSHPRGYYRPNTTDPVNGYDPNANYPSTSSSAYREWQLLRNALSYVDNTLHQFPADGSVLDADGDGFVDAATFVIQGGPDGWGNLLWYHMWSMYTDPYALSNGKKVLEYSFQLQQGLGPSVLSHEMFHVIGAPDLYHYGSYGADGMDPVGAWDLMAANNTPPQHMDCYMKFRYPGWISSIPVLNGADGTGSGTATLNPLTSSFGNCFRLNSPISATEYFVVEYRNGSGTFEGGLPPAGYNPGLVVYRINSARDGQGNGDATINPDPGKTAISDEVYAFRPGGTINVNGSTNLANLNPSDGRTRLNDYYTDPKTFAWNDAASGPLGIHICNVSAAGATISFDYGPDKCETSASPSSHDFGTVNVGQSSAIQTFTLTNRHGQAVQYGTLSSSDPNFSIGNDQCSIRTVNPGVTCTFDVAFSPLAGGLYNATITIPDNVVTAPANKVTVTGTGFNASAPTMELSQGATSIANGGSYGFGNRAVGSNTDIVFTISNSGGADLNITTPLTVGGADAGQFSVQAQPSANVAAGGSTTFTVRFSPTSAGAKSASISIANDDTAKNPYVLNLGGTGVVYCSPAGMDGSGEYITLVQLNGGSKSTGATAGGYANYTGTNFATLSPGYSYLAQVTGQENYTASQDNVKVWVDFNQNGVFTDTGEELDLGTVTFTGSHLFSGNLSVPVDALQGPTRMRVMFKFNDLGWPPATPCANTGYGEAEDYTVTIGVPGVPEMDLSQGVTPVASNGTYDFGSKATGTNTDVVFNIANSGTGDLTFTMPLVIDGADADQFSIQAQPASGVAAGDNTTFTVRFSPTSTGAKSASISIANNDSDENPYVLNLNGTGTDAPPSMLSFARLNPATATTSADTLTFRATFSEDVREISVEDFVVNGSTAGVSGLTSTGSDGNWTWCADENGYCDFTGNTLYVRFGSGSTYSYGVFADGVNCTNAVFGDPTPNVAKTCESAAVVSANVFDITVSEGNLANFNGTVGLNLDAGQDIEDMAGNALPLTEPAIDQVYTLSNIYSKTIQSTGTADGWILESGLNTNKGGSMDSSSAYLNLGDDAAKKQYRSILSFATGAGLPDNAVITKVTLKVKLSKIYGGGNPVTTFGGFMADVRNGFFGKATLELTDWQSTNPFKTVGPYKVGAVGGWYTLDLTGAKSNINKLAANSGLTQIRLRFKTKYTNNTIANYLTLFSGNAAAASRPVLTVQYTIP